MSFRARPNSTRTRTWEDRDRRSMLLNIGFGVTIVAALLLLVIAAGVTWYGDHLVSAGSVNGESISKDAYNRQLAVNSFRTDYQARRLRTLLTAGPPPRGRRPGPPVDPRPADAGRRPRSRSSS